MRLVVSFMLLNPSKNEYNNNNKIYFAADGQSVRLSWYRAPTWG